MHLCDTIASESESPSNTIAQFGAHKQVKEKKHILGAKITIPELEVTEGGFLRKAVVALRWASHSIVPGIHQVLNGVS